MFIEGCDVIFCFHFSKLTNNGTSFNCPSKIFFVDISISTQTYLSANKKKINREVIRLINILE